MQKGEPSALAGGGHLLHIFSTFAPAGPQQRTAQLIHALGDEFTHTVVALDGRIDGQSLLADAPHARVLPWGPTRGTRDTIGKVKALIKDTAPAAVLTYNWGAVDAVLASKITGRQAVIHHEDGFGPDEANGFKRRRIWYRRLVLRSAHRVVVISSRLHECAKALWKVPSARLAFIPNGIHLSRYTSRDGNDALRQSLGIAPNAFVIGAVGHLRKEKNFGRLIATFADFVGNARSHLVIVGDGELKTELQNDAERLGVADRVHLVGHISDPRAHYTMMDLFCVTSDTEQMPISVLEAMASELPIVSTDVGDIKHMVDASGRRFVVPDTVDVQTDLVDAVRALAEDGKLRRELGNRNRHKIEEMYSFESMQSSYRELYHSALSASRRHT